MSNERTERQNEMYRMISHTNDVANDLNKGFSIFTIIEDLVREVPDTNIDKNKLASSVNTIISHVITNIFGDLIQKADNLVSTVSNNTQRINTVEDFKNCMDDLICRTYNEYNSPQSNSVFQNAAQLSSTLNAVLHEKAVLQLQVQKLQKELDELKSNNDNNS